ncbi:Rap GTPase-activating protein [Entamoeba marina]
MSDKPTRVQFIGARRPSSPPEAVTHHTCSTSPSGIDVTGSYNSLNKSDRLSTNSNDMKDNLYQRIVQLEDIVHDLTEENETLKQRVGEMPRTPQQVNKEFEYFCTQFPIRGGSFLTGQIDPRMTSSQQVVTINFPSPFPEVPIVFVFQLSVTNTSNKLTPTSKDAKSFTVKFEEPITDVCTIFWIAYSPIKVRSKFKDLLSLLNGAQTPTLKQVENAVSSYVKKHGVTDQDEDGNTLLHHLIELDYPTMVELLLNKGADVNALNKFRYSPLHTALSQKKINMDIVQKLFELNAVKNIKNESMRTPIHYLCRNPTLDKYISLLYQLLADNNTSREYVTEVSKLGETALTCVCSSSLSEDAIQLLCEKGSDVNRVTENGMFPLFYAVRSKNVEIMEILLKNGADIDMCYKDKSIMQIAEETGQMEKLVLLIEKKFELSIFSSEEIRKAQDKFESPRICVEKWTNNTTRSKIILVDNSKMSDYHIENFYTSCTHKDDDFMKKNYHNASLTTTYFQKYIKPYPHNTYYVKHLDQHANPLDNNIYDPKLTKFENYFIFCRYKFGVLYCKEGQTQEQEMFNNQYGSKHFEKFLELLGKKTPLKGFTGFAGGLDTTSDLTGEYSYTNTFSCDAIQIMFHVSTYLPWSNLNDQQLDRKKHIGNDVVVLIFKEYSKQQDMIDVSSFKTQFNHAFIVVGYDLNQPESETPHYSVNVCCKYDIPPIPPFITTDSYYHSQLFSQFLIAKLINAEEASKESKSLKTKQVMVRGQILESMIP